MFLLGYILGDFLGTFFLQKSGHTGCFEPRLRFNVSAAISQTLLSEQNYWARRMNRIQVGGKKKLFFRRKKR
jgi:hypothetical protein